MRSIVGALLLTSIASAHDPGLSGASICIEPRGVQAELVFHASDIANCTRCDTDGDGRISGSEVAAGQLRLIEFARHGIRLDIDGKSRDSDEAFVEVTEYGELRFLLHWSSDGAPKEVAYHFDLIRDLPRGHRHYAAILDARSARIADALLSHERSDLVARIEFSAPVGAWGRITEFFGLGVEHILTGYDHLAFLLALLLVARSLRAIAVLITSFTLAHSISLGVATLDLWRPPSDIVEAIIAASILWVGIENLLRREPSRRWITTFCFGLVHGFGFASALRETGISNSGGVVIPLLSFNLGVEAGQLAVAAVLLPGLWWIGRSAERRARLVPALSVLVGLSGAFWFLQRTLPHLV